MDLELILQRRKTDFKIRTPGDLYINGVWWCFTLEDEIREVPGVAVDRWKVYGKTAIPSGRYLLTLENSPHFGPDTPTINAVPGFVGVRMHSGNDEDDTDGCPVVGYELTAEGTIAVGHTRPAQANLKRLLKVELAKRSRAFIDVRNP